MIKITKKGDTITAQRLKNGWSQAELARRCHMAALTVCRIERGDNVLPATAKSITDALGLSFDDCFTYTNE